MNKLKKHIFITIVTAMTSSYCMAVESWDCDGTTLQNCSPQSSINPCQWSGSGGNSNNADVETSAGSADIQVCTSSDEDQGNCSQNGTVACSYTTTVTDNDTGKVIYQDTVGSNPATYTC